MSSDFTAPRSDVSKTRTWPLLALAGGLLAVPVWLAGCGGGGESDPGQASGGSEASSSGLTPKVEYFDPETKLLKKSEGETRYGTYVGARTWWHENQQVAKEGQYDDQGRKTGEWKEFHRTNGLPSAQYTYCLLYTSDAADELKRVVLGASRRDEDKNTKERN